MWLTLGMDEGDTTNGDRSESAYSQDIALIQL
jgi:hypothetical protein